MCFKFKINMKHLLYYLYWKQDIKWAGGRTSKVKIPLIFLKGKWTVKDRSTTTSYKVVLVSQCIWFC